MPRRFNCCVFNHPCPIFCSAINLACSNQVVNPNFGNDFAFFNNTVLSTVDAGDVIPVVLVTSEGTSIVSNGAGGATLLAGAYEVSYLANGVVPTSGTFGIRLDLNGATVQGSPISITQTAGDVVNLTQTMIITTNGTSSLELLNNSAETVNFNYASLSIRRI